MERWSVGVNGYFGHATIYRERGPWWAFALEAMAYRLLCWTPGWRVPFIGRIPITREWIDGTKENTTIGDWYGDTLCCWATCAYNEYQTIWWNRYIRRHIDVPLADIIAAWGDEAPRFWREQWDEGTESWKRHGPPDASRGKVFRTHDATIPPRKLKAEGAPVPAAGDRQP